MHSSRGGSTSERGETPAGSVLASPQQPVAAPPATSVVGSAYGSNAPAIDEEEYIRLKRDHNALRLDMQELQAEKDALIAQRESLRALERRHGVLRANHDQAKFKYDTLNKRHAALQKELEELKQTNIGLKARHLELQTMEPQLTKAKEELDGQMAQKELQRAKIRELTNERDALEKKLRIARTSAARATNANNPTSVIADSSESAENESTESGGDIILDDAVAHAEIREEHEKLQQNYTQLQKSHAELTEHLEDAEERNEKMKDELDTARATMHDAQASLREVSERRTQLQDTLLEVQRRYEQLAASRDGGGRLGREVSTSNELRMDKLSLENRVAGLRSELQCAKEQTRSQKASFDTATKKLKMKLECMEMEKSQALEKVKKLGERVQALEDKEDSDGMEMSPRPPPQRLKPMVPAGPDLWDRAPE